MTYTTRTPESDALNAFHFLQAYALHEFAAPTLSTRLGKIRRVFIHVHVLVFEIQLEIDTISSVC